MKIYIYSLLLLILVIQASCTEFLDESPSKNSQVEIKTADQLNALLGNYFTFFREKNVSCLLGTDDFGLTADLYKEEINSFYMKDILHILWDVDGVANDTREYSWVNEYSKIFYANLVLDYLPKVSGDKNLKEKLRREAYFIRAVSYWQLINTYAKLDSPENQNEPGVTLKSTISFEESTKRATIAQCYQQIEADLKIALEETTPLLQDGKTRPWRISSSGVKAFASRYYLQKGNYEKALEYSEKALSEYSTLVDYNTEFHYNNRQLQVRVNNEVKKLDVPYTWSASEADMISWKEFYYSRVLYNYNGWYIPSESLLNLYDKNNDLRYKYHIVEDYSFYRKAKRISYPGYVFFTAYNIPSGPSVPEMLLIKAECLIRKGQLAEGMATIEILRKKRIQESGYVPLVAVNQAEALRHVFEERRREMPFSKRWFDARRLNQNNDPSDDIEFKRVFYSYSASSVDFDSPLREYKLGAKSLRWASPIPYTEIVSSQNQIVQNKY